MTSNSNLAPYSPHEFDGTTIKIEITGRTHIGKTTLAAIAAKAIAAYFEEVGALVPVSVINRDGDYPHAYRDVSGAGVERRVPTHLQRVVIVDGEVPVPERRDVTDDIRLSAMQSVYPGAYIGTALPELSDEGGST